MARFDPADCDLQKIVDGLLNPSSHDARLGWVPASRRAREVNPKLADIKLDEADAVRDDSFVTVGRRGDDPELILGFLGTGKWRRLKSGVAMDSAFSIDTMPPGHATGIKMCPIPAN